MKKPKSSSEVGAIDEKPKRGRKSGTEGTGTVHRTIKMIAAVAGARSTLGVGELANKLSLPIPTTHRLLHLLRDEGIVDWDSRTHRYGVGPELFRLGAQVASNTDLREIVRTEMTKVAEQTGETMLFGLYQPASAAMSFEERIEGNHPLQYRIQMHVPLSLVWGASGKAILAFLPEESIHVALDAEQNKAQNGSSKPDFSHMQAELERFRKAGFGASEGEKLIGARGVAAPVFGPNGVIGSVCMTSPMERIPVNRIAEFGELIVNCAKRISRSLGADDV